MCISNRDRPSSVSVLGGSGSEGVLTLFDVGKQKVFDVFKPCLPIFCEVSPTFRNLNINGFLVRVETSQSESFSVLAIEREEVAPRISLSLRRQCFSKQQLTWKSYQRIHASEVTEPTQLSFDNESVNGGYL